MTERNGALDELAQFLLDQLRVFLADGFAEHVGFGEAEPCEHIRDAHHLLLIGDDAVGRLQDLLEARMGVADRFLAELPLDEDEVHAGVERTGAEQGVGGDQVVEPVALHVAESFRRERRLELEDPGGTSRAQELVDLRVLQVECVDIDGEAVPLPDHLHRIVDHRQGTQAQHVHLEHADLFQRTHLELRDDGVFALRILARAPGGRGTDRHILAERARGDHHARGMHRCMA